MNNRLFNALAITLLAAPLAAQAAVLWDQPLSASNQSAYVNQNFLDYANYSSYLADDFSSTASWSINKIFVPGNFWNGGTSLGNATSLSFAIYGNDGGRPSGYPGNGSAQWSLSLAPTNAQIALSSGSDGALSDVTLTLATSFDLPAGDWWFFFYPDMSFSEAGQYGRQPSDTTNGVTVSFINPGGGFGYGSGWQDWTVLGVAQTDIAFRLEGTEGDNGTVPEPGVLSLLALGLIGLATLRRRNQ